MNIQIVILLLLFIFISCEKQSITFIGDYEFKTGTIFNGSALGGLSGLSIMPDGKLMAISDDRGKFDYPRAFIFNVIIKLNRFSVLPHEILYFKNSSRVRFKKGRLDLEDIVYNSVHDIYVVSERNLSGDKLVPEIIKFSSAGIIINSLDVPTEFAVIQNQGIRNNKGFESLAITKDKKYLFTANEDALIQDGPMASLSKGSKIRLLRYVKNGNSYSYEKYFTYLLSKIPNPTDLKKAKYADNGLVAMVALDHNTLLVMERSFVLDTRKNSVRIFKVVISERNNQLKKTLMLDLNDIIPLLKVGNKQLDNLEGMCLGPKLDNGKQSLILVSDNNFSKHQRTLFLAFQF